MGRLSVVVVGGGVSGLAAAWELSGGAAGPTESSPRVEVVEASERFGGALATTQFAGRTIDLGADGFLARRPEAVTMVNELGLGDRLEAINASGAWLWSRGDLHELPGGIVLGVPTDLGEILRFKGVTWRARLAARRDVYFPRRLHLGDDATVGEIVRAKLGDELSSRLVEPMIGGIQAGRIDQLSALSVFPTLLDAARRGGSLMKALRSPGPVNPGPRADVTSSGPAFYTLTSGAGSLAGELVRKLQERGVVLRSAVAVTALRRTPAGSYPWEVDTLHTTTPANAVILAAPAPIAARLLGSLDPALARLSEIESAGAAMVTFALAREEITLPASGTGILVPLLTPWAGHGSMMVTAVTLLDRKWPHLAKENEVVLRAHVGRVDDVRWNEMSDEELTRRVSDELAVLFTRFGTPTETLVQRWPRGLPQYRVGHERLVDEARAAGARFAVALAGIAYDGVGVPASIGSGRRAALQVLSEVGTVS